MMKRLGKFFAVCSCLLLCCAVLFGCAGRADLLGAPKGTPETLSRTERESEGLAALQESSEAFAARFAAAAYAAQAGRGNMAASPLSVYMALAMEAEAAAGATREELLGALGTDAGTLRENFALLYRSAFFEGEKRKALLSNSIWLAQELPVQQACVDTLAEKYFCRSYHTDFAGDSEGANRAIRRFVKEQTNGLIDQNFELPAETYFAVINTLYLKDLWNGAGNDLPLTEETYTFAQADGSAAETQLMRGYYASGRPQAGEHFSYFFAETEGGNRLLFLLPDEGYSVQDVFTEENIAETVAADDYGDYNEEKTVHYNTRCLFPAFAATYNADVCSLLREHFGVNALFDDSACDLSALLGRASGEGTPYACTGIAHVTKLEVDRGGIEGAAATVVADGATSAEPIPTEEVYLDFVVDRAFGFAIVDGSGNTLFSGAVETLA